MTVKLVLLLALSVMVVGCGEPYEKKAEREKVVREDRTRKVEAERSRLIAELQAAHQADDQWAKEPFAWTIDLQERLIRPGGRPIVGIARLRDVERRGTSRILHLIPSPYEQPRVEFFLKCDEALGPTKGTAALEGFLGERLASLSYPEYVFVARVARVTRRDISFDQEGTIDTRPQWRAEGECLGLREIVRERNPAGTDRYGR